MITKCKDGERTKVIALQSSSAAILTIQLDLEEQEIDPWKILPMVSPPQVSIHSLSVNSHLVQKRLKR